MVRKTYKKLINLSIVFAIAVFTAIIISAFTIQAKAAIPGGIIDDAVYALQNKATGEYLDIQNNSPLTDKYMIMKPHDITPSTSETRSALFKFSHVGSNSYIIRTMRNNGVTFYRISDTAVKTTLADPVDSNNSSDLYWYLSDDGNGYYYLQASNTQKYLCAPTSGVNCTTESSSLAGDRAKWTLIKYTGPTIRGLMFFTSPSAVYMESQTQYKAYMWTTDMSNNGPVTWSVYTYGDWSQPCSSTISSTGLLQTNAVYETLAVCARANFGVVYTKQVTVNPPIQTGLYSICSVAASNMYMNVRGDSYRSGDFIQQYKSTRVPNEESLRAFLYKVEWTGEGNKYIIRTMTNNVNGFKAVNNTLYSEIKTCQITSSDPGFWYITCVNSSGSQPEFIIKNGSSSSSYAIGVKYDTVENKYNSGSKLELKSCNDIEAKWNFIEPTGLSTFSACKVNYLEPYIIEYGSSALIHPNYLETAYFYSTDMSVNTSGNIEEYQIHNLDGNPSSIADLVDGFVIGKPYKAGMVSVTIKFQNITSLPFNLYIKPPSDEYFFLQNIEGALGCVKSNGSYSSKENFIYNDKQIWRMIDAGYGYYYIRNMDGNYLTAPNSTSTGINIGLESSLLSDPDRDRQKWQIVDVTSGSNAKIIKSKNTGTLNLYLCIDPNNNNLIQGAYNTNDNSYYDEFNVVILGDNVVYLRTFSDYEDIDVSNEVQNLYPHYNGFELIYLRNQLGNHNTGSIANYKIALNMLENSKVMVIAGHADPTKITISDYYQPCYLTNNHLSDPDVDLSDVDIVIFDGCRTAGDPPVGQHNLAESAAIAGAKVSIGWTTKQSENAPAEWIENFLIYLNTTNDQTGLLNTALQAYNKAKNDSTGYSSFNCMIYGTDTSFSFN